MNLMPTERFEREILKLLKRMKERKEQKGKMTGKRRKLQKSSRFGRELKKFEYSMNSNSARGM